MSQDDRCFLRYALKYALLFTVGISVLLASGCTALLPDDSSPSLTEITPPAAKNTPTLPPGETSWLTLAPAAGHFDYYVLALSWAPDYCSDNPGDAQECSLGRKYAFVLHGLWPQYAIGYPADCGGAPLPASVKAQFPNLYPNEKLYDHEWNKHGTCTGLTPAAYLSAARQLKARVQIPDAYIAPASPFRVTVDELKGAFLQANPALRGADLAPNCSGSGRYLTELDICFSKDGQPAACGADVQKTALKSCANADFLVRNVR
jgi:ribonuclease T2